MINLAGTMTGACVISGVVVALMLSGCGYYDYYYDEQQDLTLQRERVQMQQRMQTMNQQNDRYGRDIAALRADLQAFQETQRRLFSVLDELREENHRRGEEIEKLRSLVSSLESRVATSDANWRQDMTSFQESLSKDQKRAMTKLTTNLAEEMQRNLQQMRKAAAAQRAAREAAYGEYTVQPGDTLSAIAQAFNVSVSAVKEANGLTSDIIRVGQKLKIPAN